MKIKNNLDLICAPRCFDIHKESLEEIKYEIHVFLRTLKDIEEKGQDTFTLGYLYSRSFNVLEQILIEYFKDK